MLYPPMIGVPEGSGNPIMGGYIYEKYVENSCGLCQKPSKKSTAVKKIGRI